LPVTAYLYDADGRDHALEIGDVRVAALTERQLLWINIEQFHPAVAEELSDELGIGPNVMRRLGDLDRPSHLDNYGSHFAFRVETPYIVDRDDKVLGDVKAQVLGFVVAQRWLITTHADDIPFLSAFQAQDKGETRIGTLTPALLAASLLDWHLAEFFTVASKIEAEVDALDERILAEGADRPILNKIVGSRKRVAELRSLIARQRPVFHGLTRPDFALNTDDDAADQFARLANRYDRAVDEVERTREVVVGSFDVFTSMSSEETNDLVKALTVFTVIIGFSAAVAGLLGMNFDAPLFHSGAAGFTVAAGGLVALSLVAIVIARIRHWI
jgi:magnesium transporter